MPRDLALGIDLGTTQSYMAFVPQTGKDKVRVLPCNPSLGSDAKFRKDREKAMPSSALLNSTLQQGSPAIELFVGRSADSVPDQYSQITRFKALLGKHRDQQQLAEYAVKAPGSEDVVEFAAPEAVAGYILWTMLRLALESDQIHRSEVRDISITVPALCSVTQRKATQFAARLAGFSEGIFALEEPVAAFLYHYYRTEGTLIEALHEPYVLVFDFGGGTCDTSIINVESGRLPIVLKRKSAELGGEKIDELIVRRWLNRGNKRERVEFDDLTSAERHLLRLKARLVKERLSEIPEYSEEIGFLSSQKIELGKRSLTRKTLSELLTTDRISCLFDFQYERIGSVMELVEELLEALLTEAGITKKKIGAVILAGGSSNLLQVQDWMKRWIGDTVAPEKFIAADLETSIACGAAVHQFYRHHRDKKKRRIVEPTLPWDVWFGHSDNGDVGSWRMELLERKDRVLPTKGHVLRIYDNVESQGGSVDVKLCLRDKDADPIFDETVNLGLGGTSVLQVGYRITEDAIIEGFYCAPGRRAFPPIYTILFRRRRIVQKSLLTDGGVTVQNLLNDYRLDNYNHIDLIRRKYGIQT